MVFIRSISSVADFAMPKEENEPPYSVKTIDFLSRHELSKPYSMKPFWGITLRYEGYRAIFLEIARYNITPSREAS